MRKLERRSLGEAAVSQTSVERQTTDKFAIAESIAKADEPKMAVTVTFTLAQDDKVKLNALTLLLSNHIQEPLSTSFTLRMLIRFWYDNKQELLKEVIS